MQTPYQHVAYPPPPPHHSFASPLLSSAAQDDTNCCACSHCCTPGQCCSRVGSCPCLCSTPCSLFSSAVISFFFSLVLLITGTLIEQYFSVYNDLGHNSWIDATIGPWQQCSDTYYYGCQATPDYGPRFQAFRALLTAGTAFCLLAGVLASVRLGMQQRGKGIGRGLEWSTSLAAFLAWATTSASFGLATAFGWYNQLAVSWVLHLVAVILLSYALLAHAITACYQSRTQAADEGSDAESASISSQYPSAFSHPSPVQFYPAQPQPPTYVYGQPLPPSLPGHFAAPMHTPVY